MDPGQTASLSSLIWVHTVCDGLYAELSARRKHFHAQNNFNRQHFQMHFFVAGEGLTPG